jgi:hypothetical protein
MRAVVNWNVKYHPKEQALRTRSSASVLIVFIILLLLPLHGAFCQDNGKKSKVAVYSLGQQTVSLNAGLLIPLFFQSFNGSYSDATNLKLGGSGSLQWGIHLDNHWLVGLEVAGMFSKSLQKNFLYQVPILVRGAYIFHIFPFEFPVFLGLGMDIVKYSEQTHINFIMKPGFSSLWKYNISWGFGLNAVYWWVPQPWAPDKDKGRMGNFLEVTLTAQYSF